jgi:hypothetical protein
MTSQYDQQDGETREPEDSKPMNEYKQIGDLSQQGQATIPSSVVQTPTLLQVHSLPLEIYEQILEEDFIDEQGVVQGQLIALVNRHLSVCEPSDPFDEADHLHVIWLNGNHQMRVGLVPPDWNQHRLIGRRLFHQHRCIDLLSELLAVRTLVISSVTHYSKSWHPQIHRFEVELNQYHLQLSGHICRLVERQQEHSKQSHETLKVETRETHETQQYNSDLDDSDLDDSVIDFFARRRGRSRKKRRPSLAQQLEQTTQRIIDNLHKMLQFDQQDVCLWPDREHLPEPDALWSFLIQKKQRLAEYEQRLRQVSHQMDQLDQIFVLRVPHALEQRST